jgi:outer membrane protein OmpA-like peptidoglycan-associated protein
LGIPINSGGDETDFQISPDGLSAFFTSNRKMGIGGDDIYMARFKEKRIEQTFVSDDLGFLNYTAIVDTFDAATVQFENSLKESVNTNTAEQQSLNPISVDLPFLYYSEDSELFNKENREILDQLLPVLKANPFVTAEIMGHSGKQAIEEYNIFSSIKLAERVQQYLVDRGIQPDRIFTKGLGFNYPIIKTEREGGDDRIAEMYNARIAVRLHGTKGQEVVVNQIYPDVDELLFNTKAPLYEALVYDELSYKIQLIMMNQMYRGKLLSYYNDATVERDEETGLYVYTIGLYDSFNKALQVSRDLERDGWTDVSVAPYINGLRIREEDFVYYVNDFPDLGNMMNYKK